MLLLMATLIAASVLSFAWGHEGHEVVALIAEHYMTSSALAKDKEGEHRGLGPGKGHRSAQSVAYGDLDSENPAAITRQTR